MIAVCAAVMAVCSWISIPAVVPFTLHLDATWNGSAAEYVKIKTIASTF